MKSTLMRSNGLAPIIGANASVLILGSLPGQRSLQEREYYAHPQNLFWRVMARLVDVDPASSYANRCNTLKKNRIALWDVLASSRRPGSLDSAIEMASARKNDFVSLLDENQGIQMICFNGRKSRQLFDRLVLKDITANHEYEFMTLPSTSAAFAAMGFDEKLQQWSVIQQSLKKEKL